jgi:eukaryotic-like serine/threonine-protein kinase
LIDLAGIRQAFPELDNVKLLSDDTGQRVVLSAEHSKNAVVLKILRPSQDPARTEREIEAIARLKSSRVPKLIDHGKRTVGPTEVLYIIEEKIDGETLRVTLDRRKKPDLPFVMQVGDELLQACAEFEACKLVHRDLKPANIMLDRAGKLWVIDFGIARLLDLPSLTKTAAQFGVFSPGYGAPEQIRNVKSQINSRADLFSVGVVLFEMLTGVNPYLQGARDTLDVLRRMLTLDLPIPTHPKDTKGELGLFVSSVGARYPSRRPQNTTEARDWYAHVRKVFGARQN